MASEVMSEESSDERPDRAALVMTDKTVNGHLGRGT